MIEEAIKFIEAPGGEVALESCRSEDVGRGAREGSRPRRQIMRCLHVVTIPEPVCQSAERHVGVRHGLALQDFRPMSGEPHPLPGSGLRFIGYLNRRPYLWCVDLVNHTIEPAARDLKSIPQGIDGVVPMPDSVGVSCGPHRYHLKPDLSGKFVPMDDHDKKVMKDRSQNVAVRQSEGRTAVIGLGDRDIELDDDRVGQWAMSGTVSPDGTLLAISASTVQATADRDQHYARHAGIADILSVPAPASPSLLFLIDIGSGQATACDGTFENFCYPPAWSASGQWIVFGAPFDPKTIFIAHRDGGPLQEVRFRRNAPMPMIDLRLLPGVED